jgi:hypothetical protein
MLVAIGTYDQSKRLGVANLSWPLDPQYPNPSGFGYTVLRLPANSLIYQQMIARSTELGGGSDVAAMDTCCHNKAYDSTVDYSNVLREVSVHDTYFSRRNISTTSQSGTQCAFLYYKVPNLTTEYGHSVQYVNQLYYVNNEPEMTSRLRGDQICGGCWNPRDRLLDAAVAAFFPTPNTQFWEVGIQEGINGCGIPNSPWWRVRALAMAWVYLRLRNIILARGRGHTLLPPSAISAVIGAVSQPDPFWQDFYTAVKNGVSAGNGQWENGIGLAEIGVLHVHEYTPHPSKVRALNPVPASIPMHAVAWSVNSIRRGAKWLRNDLYGQATLPVDLLVSEMGVSWPERDSDKSTYDPKLWAGYYDNYRDGLAWWNTWLCWLLRRAPAECDLVPGKAAYSCLHNPDAPPYITSSVPTASRTQIYFNADTWAIASQPNMAAVRPQTLQGGVMVDLFQNGVGTQSYSSSFTSNTPIRWPTQSVSWYSTPLGVCYTIWAQVGVKAVTKSLSTGWIESRDAGTVVLEEHGALTTFQIQLPAGWSTVYFPIIKSVDTFPYASQITIRWIRSSDGFERSHGYMDLKDVPDGYSYRDFAGATQWIYPAMVYPVVCKKASAGPVTFKLVRNIAGPLLWIGPPVVLQGACSWLAGQ